MKYEVIWSAKAEEALAAIWMHTSDRDAVTRAASDIDRALQNRPLDIGESRDAGRRVYFAVPLGVAYLVRPHDMLVRVLRLWHIKKRVE